MDCGFWGGLMFGLGRHAAEWVVGIGIMLLIGIIALTGAIMNARKS
jgi:hypothetical protein